MKSEYEKKKDKHRRNMKNCQKKYSKTLSEIAK